MKTCPVRCCGLSRGAGRDPPLLARAGGWQARAPPAAALGTAGPMAAACGCGRPRPTALLCHTP